MEDKKIKILAIDDNRDNLISLKAIISEALPQSVVYTELSGQGGIESARKNEPDVILLDIVMPEMDGYEVCKIIKADKQLSETPIIFLTALKGDKQSRILALEAGGEAFLAKPIDPTELKAQMQAMLKIKEAASFKKDEKLLLEDLVQKRTEELKNVNIATLNLLEDLNTEIEIRKKREYELIKSEKKFRNLFQNHSAVKLIVNPKNGEIIDANNAAAKFYGWSVEDLLEMTMFQINTMPAEELKIELEKARSKKKFNFEMTHRKADGSLIDVEIFSSSLKIDDMELLHSIIHDISDKKKAEKNLILLNRAVESSSVSVVITDDKGNINYVNPFFSIHSGYSQEEALGKNPRILKTENQQEGFYKDLWDTILSGKDWTGEFLNRKKNGEHYWERALISPILNSKGQISNFVAIKEDITESKKLLEELVVAKEKAEESDKLKSAFLVNMSHEIRTPMNGILGFSELLKDPELSDEKQKAYIENIAKSGQRMLNIINDIIAISKIESGIKTLSNKTININDTIEDIYTLFKPVTESKNLRFNRKYPLPASKAIIVTDQEKLNAILTYLIKNAIKYTEVGFIEIGYTEISNNEMPLLKIYVRDTGIGIPKERQKAIFERFIKADIKDVMAYQGAGLGLAISTAYVEMLGGKIWVESEEGLGSTFYFTLPNDTKSSKELTEKQPESLEKYDIGRKLKILIVENDEISEILIDNYITMIGEEIFTAKNGLEAVEVCRKNPELDLIFMDINMSGTNGYAATQQIRQFNKDVVIIAQSSLIMEGEREKALKAGCNDYLAKPFRTDTLAKLIQKYFG